MNEVKKSKRKKIGITLGIITGLVVVQSLATVAAIKIKFDHNKKTLLSLAKKYNEEFNEYKSINNELNNSISELQKNCLEAIDFANKADSISEINKKIDMLKLYRNATEELIIKYLRFSLKDKVSDAKKIIDSESELEKYKSAYITFKNAIDNVLNTLEPNSTYLDIVKKIDLFNKVFETLILDKEEIDFQIEKKNFVEKMENVKNTYLWLIDVIKDTEKIDLLKPLKTFINNVNLENIKNNSVLSSYKAKLNEILLSIDTYEEQKIQEINKLNDLYSHIINEELPLYSDPILSDIKDEFETIINKKVSSNLSYNISKTEVENRIAELSDASKIASSKRSNRMEDVSTLKSSIKNVTHDLSNFSSTLKDNVYLTELDSIVTEIVENSNKINLDNISFNELKETNNYLHAKLELISLKDPVEKLYKLKYDIENSFTSLDPRVKQMFGNSLILNIKEISLQNINELISKFELWKNNSIEINKIFEKINAIIQSHDYINLSSEEHNGKYILIKNQLDNILNDVISKLNLNINDANEFNHLNTLITNAFADAMKNKEAIDTSSSN
ncbi:Uncharacterised protein [Metamycoplasma cloacale]|uniref:Uncharacterized protein n=1 Tax=Metamycoplasma cloacale TaxID=92401 RepID=A0A2Z4LLM5_9BACT|nr:hypothetical protein [Metamycoplasma cloacale]AWX42633.1 hypothetical protein DK849_00855 [Metamycoplasma cloacale]VEU79594.1 Uncharacterised protein [Metamycoplasma cloacale]